MVKKNFTMRNAVEVKCYGEWMKFSSRKKAMDFFFEGMLSCEGAEGERYKNIYCKLKEGYRKCTDDLATTAEDVM